MGWYHAGMAESDRPADGEGYFDVEGPGEHDAHLLDHDEGENDTTPCPECGAELLAFADCCYACGAQFEQEAWLVHGEGRWPRLGIAGAVAAIAGLLWWLMM